MAQTTTTTVPLNLLGAVNELLQAIGSTSVTSLQAADMSEEAADALSMINTTALEVQSMGWHFNTEEGFPVDPGTDGSITVPNNAVSVKVNARSRNKDLAQRGLRLYDRKNRTFDIGDTVYLDMVLLFEFSEIPTPIRWFIVARAGFRFGVGRAPDGTTYRFTQKLETEAESAAVKFDQETRDVTLNESSPHFANMRRR